jgi:hypothetical protein
VDAVEALLGWPMNERHIIIGIVVSFVGVVLSIMALAIALDARDDPLPHLQSPKEITVVSK